KRLRVFLAHGLADAVSHEPRGAIRANAEHPHQLMGGHTFLAGGHEVKTQRPLRKGEMARLYDGADSHGERLAACVALIHAVAMRLALNERGLIDDAAVRAHRAIRPP